MLVANSSNLLWPPGPWVAGAPFPVNLAPPQLGPPDAPQSFPIVEQTRRLLQPGGGVRAACAEWRANMHG
jgi:hypothetical protein